jgi:hypothetical protein
VIRRTRQSLLERDGDGLAYVKPNRGIELHARFPLLDRLGLVPLGATHTVHTVLLQSQIDFGIGLPPTPA